MADEKIKFTGAHYGMLLDATIKAMDTDSLEPLQEFNRYGGVPKRLYAHALRAQAHILKLKGWGEDKAVLISTDGKKEGIVSTIGAGNSFAGEGKPANQIRNLSRR